MKLEANHIYFSYKTGEYILEDVSISVESGEFVGLQGKSGRGKSTLGKILAGYEKPERGEVLLEGVSLPKKGFCPVQLMFQHPEQAVNPRFTVEKIIKESGGCALEEVGLSKEFLNRYPHELSGGQLQRVCIARGLTPDTKFIIADEITTMLDAVTQMEIWRFLKEYCEKQGIAVVVITHNRHLTEKVCNRVINL